jgi:hypothetical protein
MTIQSSALRQKSTQARVRHSKLAAMVSGVAYVAQDLLAPPLVRLMIPDDGVPVAPALEEEGIPRN